MILIGKWANEYDSIMEIKQVTGNTFTGIYSSSTGATGTYNVVGCFNPNPMNGATVVSIGITWNNINANSSDSLTQWDCASSSMTGLLQKIGERDILTVTHVLVVPTLPANSWQSSYIDKLVFVKQ